jgi:transposase
MIIGIDPHPGHYTSAALELFGKLAEWRTFPNTPAALEEFLSWLESWAEVQVAVEGPTQPYFTQWCTHLLAEGYPVVPVATQRVVERRLRAAGGKTDGRDAILVAQALLAEPDLPPLTQPDWVRALQELTRTRKALAATLKGQRMWLQDTREPMVRHALENVIDTLEAQVQALGQEIEQRVKELAPRLLQLVGVGGIIAATLLSEVADITRFASPDRFAAYCGAAPQPWQSSASQRVRVNPRGNRRLNWVLHLITRTRLRVDPTSQALVARKRQEGKTHREALRVLKTAIARQLYRVLRTLAPLFVKPDTIPH